MTDNNANPASPENQDADQSNPIQPPEAQPPAPARRKRRRRWPWVIAALFLLLVLFVLISPTLLSMGWARSLVISQVNGRLNGSVQIKDWSLGWFSPVKAEGIVVNDQSNRQILQLPQLTTGLTLLDIVRGKYSLGQTRIEGLDILVSREPDGTLNWQHISKSEPSSGAPATGAPPIGKTEEASGKLPDVSGELVLSNCSLTYEDRTGRTQPVYLRSMQADVKIPDINSPISESFSADATVGSNPPGTFSTSGTIAAVTNNQVSLDTADIDQTIKLTGVELAAISGLLGPAAPADLAGRADGQVVLRLTKGTGGTLQATLGAQRLSAAGGKLGDEKLTASSLTIRVPSAAIRLPHGATGVGENAKLDLGEGASFQLANINVTQGTRLLVQDDTLNFDARGGYVASAGGRALHFTRLDLSDVQQMIAIHKSPDVDLEATLPTSGNPSAKGGIDIAADLKRLNDVLQSMSAKIVAKDANQMDLQSAKLDGRLTFAQENADRISLAGNLNVTQISVGNATSSPIKDEKIQISFKALANKDEIDPTLDATGDLISAHLTDAKLSLAGDATSFQKLKKMTLTVQVPSLPKVQALLRSFSPAKPATAQLLPGPALAFAGKIPPKGSMPAGGAQDSPPTDITGGSATLTIKAEPDGQNLHVLPQATISNLALKRGEESYSLSTIGLNGDTTIVPAAGGQIQEVRVTKSDLDFNDLTIKGQPYSEKQLHLGTVLALSPASHVLDLKNLTFESPTTKAISLVAAGRILDIGSTQRIDNVLTLDLDYDASQLLKLVIPLLSPDLQAKLKDAQASGKYHKRFEVRGAYPSGVEFAKAIQQITAGADIQLDSFDGAGLTLRNVDLPFALAQGFARIIYADKPTGQNLPPPIVLNGGTFNIGGSQIDLRGLTPTLSILDNYPVLDNVALNPIFATWALGTMLDNPLFVEVKEINGYLSLRVLTCRDLPLDSTLTSASAGGNASLDLSIRQLQFTGGLLQNLSDVAHLNSTSVRGDVPSWRINVSHGILDQDLTMTLAQGQRPLKMYGKVRLADKRLMPLTIELPWKLFGIKGVPKEVAGFMPDGIVIPMTGTLEKPQLAFDFNKTLKDAAGKSILPGILGPQGGQPSTSQPADQPDPLKQLQDLFKKKKKNN